MLTIIMLFSVVSVIIWPVHSTINVYFRLYNQSNPETFQICTTDNITKCYADASLPFKIISHGYLSGPMSGWLLDAKNKYFFKGSYNVIIIDWSSLSNATYPVAAEGSKYVGNVTGEFIHKLHTEKLVPFDQIHLIGHSLGAHVCGFAGKYVTLISGESVARITGLDPASQPFMKYSETEKLFRTDANFVDVIHTDSYVTGNPQTEQAIANFFPNGGMRVQPGCLSKRRKRLIDTSIPDLNCSHGIACVFFIESINSDRFVAKECDNYDNYLNKICCQNNAAIMGENVDINTVGSYYLKTNASSPYAEGPYCIN